MKLSQLLISFTVTEYNEIVLFFYQFEFEHVKMLSI